MKMHYSPCSSSFFKAARAWVLLASLLPCTLLLANNPPTGAVTITGTATQSQTLTADNNLTDSDGLGAITYQWYRDGVPITYGGTLKDGVGGVDGLGGADCITLSSDNAHVYVTAFGDNSVSWFERNASTGALTYGGTLKDGVGGVDGLDGAIGVSLSPDGSHAYVSSWTDDSVNWFERNATTGALTYVGVLKSVNGLHGASSVTISPTGAHAYVSSAHDHSVSWFERNATTGALAYEGMVKDGVNGVDGLARARHVELSPDGSHAYVVAENDDSVSWFDRNASTGALTYGGTLKNGVGGVDGLDGASRVMFSEDGTHAYVIGFNQTKLSWFVRNPSTGALSYVGTLEDGVGGVDGLNGTTYGVRVSPDGLHVYVATKEDDSVSWFDRNASTGALSYGGLLKDGVGGVDGLDWASSVIISPDGFFAYVTTEADNSVSWFTRNPVTGTLSYGPASDTNYTLTSADVGAVITVTASYVDGGTTTENVTSAGTAVPLWNVTRSENLLGWWAFDDGTSNDLSGHGFDGNHSSPSIYVTDSPFGSGKAIDLAGDQYVSVSDGGDQSTFDGNDSFTIAFWVKGWPNGGWEPMISKHGDSGQGWQVRRKSTSTNILNFTLRGTSGGRRLGRHAEYQRQPVAPPCAQFRHGQTQILPKRHFGRLDE